MAGKASTAADFFFKCNLNKLIVSQNQVECINESKIPSPARN